MSFDTLFWLGSFPHAVQRHAAKERHCRGAFAVFFINFKTRGSVAFQRRKQRKMKKALGETQTLRAGCSKAEPKMFAPPQTPFPGRRTAKI